MTKLTAKQEIALQVLATVDGPLPWAGQGCIKIEGHATMMESTLTGMVKKGVIECRKTGERTAVEAEARYFLNPATGRRYVLGETVEIFQYFLNV